MKIFLAGATGAVGKSLVPLLVSRGHRVFATTRTPGKAAWLRSAGAEPVVVDGLDRTGLLEAVGSARPDVVVHQMTALSGLTRLGNLDGTFVLTNRLRTEGTELRRLAQRSKGCAHQDRDGPAGDPPGATHGAHAGGDPRSRVDGARRGRPGGRGAPLPASTAPAPDWQPAWASWREGFHRGLTPARAA